MSRTERDTTRIVRSWLEDGVDRIPDRVLDAVEARLPATYQRRAGWLARRFPIMNTNTFRFGVAAAAVVVLALIGWQFLPASNTGAGGPTATPNPTATPAPTLPPSGLVEAGTYRVPHGPTFLVTVPAGWEVVGGTGIRKHVDQSIELQLEVYPDDIRVFADACQSEGTDEPVGPTAGDLVAAVMAQENSDVSDPEEVSLGGLPATRLEVSIPTGLDMSQCSIGGLQIWLAPSVDSYLAFGGNRPDAVHTVYIADTPRGRLVLATGHEPGASAADIAELESIVGSIEIGT